MRVGQILSFGIDSLELVERPDLVPGPCVVQVRVAIGRRRAPRRTYCSCVAGG